VIEASDRFWLVKHPLKEIVKLSAQPIFLVPMS